MVGLAIGGVSVKNPSCSPETEGSLQRVLWQPPQWSDRPQFLYFGTWNDFERYRKKKKEKPQNSEFHILTQSGVVPPFPNRDKTLVKTKIYRLFCQDFAWCVKFLFVQVLRLFWEEILSPLSILSVFFFFFLPPSHQFVYTQGPATSTTKCFHWEEAGAHLVCWHQRPTGALKFNWASSSVLSVVATAVGEWLWVCQVFLAQRKVLPPSRFYIKQWCSLNVQASFLVDSPFGCHRPSLQGQFYMYWQGASSLPSICICYFHAACFSFNFSSLFIIPQYSIEGARAHLDIQASEDAKLRLSCRTLRRSKLPVQSNFSPPYHKDTAGIIKQR